MAIITIGIDSPEPGRRNNYNTRTKSKFHPKKFPLWLHRTNLSAGNCITPVKISFFNFFNVRALPARY